LKIIIDRFENGYAVAELPDGSFADIPSKLLPDAKEGDVVSIEIDADATKVRRDNMREKFNKLLRD